MNVVKTIPRGDLRASYQVFPTPYGSFRIFVENREEFNTHEVVLNVLSVWGTYDKSGLNFKSWELSSNLGSYFFVEVLHKIMERLYIKNEKFEMKY